MSNYNEQWLGVSHLDKNGYSYIQLQDIDRVSLTRQKSGENEIHQVTVYVQGEEYLYTNKGNSGDAENAAVEVLRLIEIALGRLSDSKKV